MSCFPSLLVSSFSPLPPLIVSSSWESERLKRGENDYSVPGDEQGMKREREGERSRERRLKMSLEFERSAFSSFLLRFWRKCFEDSKRWRDREQEKGGRKKMKKKRCGVQDLRVMDVSWLASSSFLHEKKSLYERNEEKREWERWGKEMKRGRRDEEGEAVDVAHSLLVLLILLFST